ncbi:alpha/beta hydrolase [Roseateles sp.]|uniref:alpha/beta fold hydrolase n=1 Tax=Roseateles sp. TaxID=1971397 RepID=UPI0025ED86C8|nr:alpha/beta hydrolase [Roseateles sp.]MBV8037812.1 alpha/beta hydrolase [Roseateles sp.]
MRRLPLVLSAALAIAGCAAPLPTQTVALGATRIAYLQTGGGPPLAVFQSGLGDGKDVWAAVIRRVVPDVAVFAYDRPGYGDSSAAPAAATAPPRDPCTIAHELHLALQVAGQRPPYILVGHSIGGLYQYAFARLYPAEVAAVLLVDPTHPDHWVRMQREAPAAARIAGGMRMAAFSPVMRAEFDAQALTGCAVELDARPPPILPVRLLVRSSFGLAETGAFESLVRRLEKGWPGLLPGTTRRQVEGAGHYIQKDRPDVVADELLALARAVPRRP